MGANFTMWYSLQRTRESKPCDLMVVRCAPLAYAGSIRSLSLEEGLGGGGGAGSLEVSRRVVG
jgi:hypothetical protein